MRIASPIARSVVSMAMVASLDYIGGTVKLSLVLTAGFLAAAQQK